VLEDVTKTYNALYGGTNDMEEDVNILTLGDALACIKLHFTEPDGLLAQIERGGEVEASQVQMIETAFRVMRSTWMEQDLVPKEATRLVHQASTAIRRLEQCRQLYPQRREMIEHFLFKVIDWVEHVFSLSSMSEEAALVMVIHHLLGTPSFNTELILGSINKSSLEELLDALDTLAHVWQQKEQISKLAAYAMVNSSWLFDRVAKLFPGPRQQRLREVEQQVSEQITRCLS
jgi:hypothetical protein